MKDARLILSLVRDACPEGVFPGRRKGERPEWPQDPFHILISTVLSQRTRDANTYAASSALFRSYNAPGQVAHAPLPELIKLIRPAGFPETKAKAIKEIGRRVHEEMGGKVPDDIDSLLSLPMVGRKTANCVLAYAFHLPAICVDTHVHRIANRIGLVRTKDPEGTEMALKSVMPRDLWIDVNSLMVRFGQTICLPRRPKCAECPVSPQCDYYSNLKLRPAKDGKVRRRKAADPKA